MKHRGMAGLVALSAWIAWSASADEPGGSGGPGPWIELDEVVVVALPVARRPGQMASAVDVVAGDDPRLAGAVALDQMLDQVPGVDLLGDRTLGADMQINLRGLTPGRLSKRTLVLVDGRRVADLYQGGVDYFGLAPMGLERIEVLRGPASYAFGSGAMGGVVNLVGRTAQDAPAPFLETRVAGGSDRTWQGRAVAGAREGAWDALGAVTYYRTDGYLRRAADGRRRDGSWWGGEGNLGWSPGEQDHLRLHLGVSGAEGRDESADRESTRNHQNLSWEHRWDGAVLRDAQVRLIRQADRLEYDWVYPGVGRYDLDLYSLDVRQTLAWEDRVRAAVGVDTRREAVDVRDVEVSVDRAEATFGAFSEGDLRLTERTVLNAGVRWDKVEGFEGEWSPRLGLTVQPVREIELYGSAGRAFRGPSVSDRYARNSFMGMLFVGNPELTPERLRAYELGARVRAGSVARFEATAFHNDLQDGFEFVLDEDGVFRNQNVSSLRNHGVELSAEIELGHGFALAGHHTWTDGQYGRHPVNPDIEGKRPAFLARHKSGGGLRWREGRNEHGVSVRYVGERFGDARNTDAQRIGSHLTVGWRSRVPLGKGTLATLDVENLLDRDGDVLPGVPAPGIRAMVGLEQVF